MPPMMPPTTAALTLTPDPLCSAADCWVTPPPCVTLIEASTDVTCVAASSVAVEFTASDVIVAACVAVAAASAVVVVAACVVIVAACVADAVVAAACVVNVVAPGVVVAACVVGIVAACVGACVAVIVAVTEVAASKDNLAIIACRQTQRFNIENIIIRLL